MPEISDKILTLTEFKHQTIIQEVNFLKSKNYTLNVILCMVSWKHEMTPESVYNIYIKKQSIFSEPNSEIPA